MTDRKDLAKRAATELSAAARALRHANALFFILNDLLSGDELALVEIGAELTSSYGERATSEAEFFERGSNHG